VNPPHQAIFRISGQRSQQTAPAETPPMATQCGQQKRQRGRNGLSPSLDSAGNSSSVSFPENVSSSPDTPGGASSSVSDGSIDSDLVRAVIDNLNHLDIEEEDVESEDWELYSVNVFDCETGQDHRLDDVRLTFSKEALLFSSSRLNFKSEQAYRGTGADMLLVEQLGPSFATQSLYAYRGRVRFLYPDRLCYPVAVSATQWCL